jgi:hypothetical protein
MSSLHLPTRPYLGHSHLTKQTTTLYRDNQCFGRGSTVCPARHVCSVASLLADLGCRSSLRSFRWLEWPHREPETLQFHRLERRPIIVAGENEEDRGGCICCDRIEFVEVSIICNTVLDLERTLSFVPWGTAATSRIPAARRMATKRGE